MKTTSRVSRVRISKAVELLKLLSESIGRSFLKRQFMLFFVTPSHPTGRPSLRLIRQSVSRIMLRWPMIPIDTFAVAFGQYLKRGWTTLPTLSVKAVLFHLEQDSRGSVAWTCSNISWMPTLLHGWFSL